MEPGRQGLVPSECRDQPAGDQDGEVKPRPLLFQQPKSDWNEQHQGHVENEDVQIQRLFRKCEDLQCLQQQGRILIRNIEGIELHRPGRQEQVEHRKRDEDLVEIDPAQTLQDRHFAAEHPPLGKGSEIRERTDKAGQQDKEFSIPDRREIPVVKLEDRCPMGEIEVRDEHRDEEIAPRAINMDQSRRLPGRHGDRRARGINCLAHIIP